MKNVLLGLLIFALTLTVFHTYFRQGFPYTNDGENHLARFANYKVALKEGQFPPRFAPNLMNHYGYPVFNFNYPLANIVSVPFSLLKMNPETTFKLISILFFVLGLVGMYKLFRINRKSLFVIIIGLTLFGVQPYLANVVLFRGSIGELLAYTLLPWIFWSIHDMREKQKISVFTILIWSAFFLSHNVTVLLVVPLICVYALMNSDSFRNRKFLLSFMCNAAVSITLTLWFWLPALLEANTTVVREAGIANQFLNHFPNLNQLLTSEMRFGFSYPGPIDSLSFQLGLASIFVIVIAVIALIKNIFARENSSSKLLFLLCSVMAVVFFQLQISTPIWQAFPQLQIVQFPWRLSILLGTLIPLLWAESAQYYSRSLKKFLLFLCIVSVYLIAQLKPIDFFHRTQIDYDLFPQSTSTQNENRTKQFTYLQVGDWQPKPKIEGEGEVDVKEWTGSQRSYIVNLLTPSRIIEPTMNFLGWQTTVQDSSGNSIEINYVENEETQGRISFDLPQGKYFVYTRFTQHTPARLVGNSISAVTGIVLGIWWLKSSIIKKNAKITH